MSLPTAPSTTETDAKPSSVASPTDQEPRPAYLTSARVRALVAATPASLQRPLRWVLHLGTSALVGIVATIADYIALVVSVWLWVPQRWAVVPAFVAGTTVQFIGNRRYTFGVQGEVAKAHFARQMQRFLAVEFVTLILNFVVYNLLREGLGLDYKFSRPISAFVVYVGFSLPMWRWVFSTR